MDFPTESIALRTRLMRQWNDDFTNETGATVCGRTVALLSTFSVSQKKKMLGLLELGGETHAGEYRVLLSVPRLDETALREMWAYGETMQRELVQPTGGHEFTLLSVILVAETVDKSLSKKMKKLQSERQYTGPGESGWSSLRLAAIDLPDRQIYVNKMGGALKNVLRPALQSEKSS